MAGQAAVLGLTRLDILAHRLAQGDQPGAGFPSNLTEPAAASCPHARDRNLGATRQ